MIITRYVLFALIATFLNLMTQRIILKTTIETNLLIAILMGTLVGLIVKYLLDKKWIFYYKPKSVIKNTNMFLKYSFIGLITTSIFWVLESIFWIIYRDDIMRELGAIIGLSIGYFIKYKIDKKYVFN